LDAKCLFINPHPHIPTLKSLHYETPVLFFWYSRRSLFLKSKVVLYATCLFWSRGTAHDYP
jgi:hypothetical protein